MHLPSELPGSNDLQHSPETGSPPTQRDNKSKSRAFWFRFEVGRSESPAEVEARRVPAEATARPTYSDGIRNWLRRIVRRGIGDKPHQAHFGTSHSFHSTHPVSNSAGLAVTRPALVSFWEELAPAERDAFLSIADSVKFTIGDRLMQEGEPADYVIVILEGHTKVCIDENGWERVLAERGPGQLVGERGGLQVRVRSASVIAVEPVRGLIATTEDFSAFVSDHPRVIDIVENQLYDRLTEDPAVNRDQHGSGAVSAIGEIRVPATAWPVGPLTAKQAQVRPLSGQNCTILLTDVVGFGSSARNDEDRLIIREALFGMTHMMLRGITDVRSEDRGDGVLTVIPPGVPTANVIERLVKELLPALARHNSIPRDSTRFQLRAAINVGPVTTDTMGVSGEAIIIAARLVEAPVFKEAIAKATADLGVIASPFVYETVIKHNRSLADYSPVQVNVKGFTNPAWIRLFSMPLVSSYFPQPLGSDSINAMSDLRGSQPSL